MAFLCPPRCLCHPPTLWPQGLAPRLGDSRQGHPCLRRHRGGRAQQVLEQLWPAPFSIDQRYRYYPNAKFLEPVSKEEEARLIAQGCTRELWRTIKPDIVLHADRSSLLRSVLTLDFKFPCPDTNKPKWQQYGENSAYADFDQGQIYKEALGGEAIIISPQGIVP